MNNPSPAPGAPGTPPRWTSSAKTGLGTSLNRSSRVWFTLSHGIFNEVYYPRLDQACIRDMGMLVTDGSAFFSDEKRHTDQQISLLAENVPAYLLVNRCKEGRYQIEKEVLTDPNRDVVLQNTKFVPLQGELADYHLYVVLAPHIANQGSDNTAWIGSYKGVPMLMASHGGISLALACTAPWLKQSAGFVGVSDGWQDINQNFGMTQTYSRAENGNVALTGEIDLSAANGSFTLALGFGGNEIEAAQLALSSLFDGVENTRRDYIAEWQAWQSTLIDLGQPPAGGLASHGLDLYHISTALLRIHEAKTSPGGLIAGLSIPWGFNKGDDDLGGYHLVWPRDLAEMAGGMLAAGAQEDARRVLNYLRSTQEEDGHWPQNMWLDGRLYWSGIQMDETAFPILLLDLARRENALQPGELAGYWPMVRRAASFLVMNGPVTQEDRWEEDPGYSPFTLGVEIAGLLAAADLAETNQEAQLAVYLRETADAWNDSIERWMYVSGTSLARKVGVDGYYVRVTIPDVADASSPKKGFVPIKNRPPAASSEPAASIVSPDALALVRFGLRAADDPRILNTVKVIDALLKLETPFGPAWHRYNDDGYGEHEDGSPFDGTGVGRAWPLLAGERAHYELAAGNRAEAVRLLHALEGFANEGGLLPEQIWDSPDIPERELFFGRPSGSAMPLGWAHAEYLKLLRSLRDGKVFDLPPQSNQRYVQDHVRSLLACWKINNKVRAIPAGKTLRIEVLSPAEVTWSCDGWITTNRTPLTDTGLGVYKLDLPTEKLGAGTVAEFTFYWTHEDRWEGTNYQVKIGR